MDIINGIDIYYWLEPSSTTILHDLLLGYNWNSWQNANLFMIGTYEDYPKNFQPRHHTSHDIV